jgi:hypothetical protein
MKPDMKFVVVMYPHASTRAIAVLGMFADERRARAWIAEHTALYPEFEGKLAILGLHGLRQLDEVLKLLHMATPRTVEATAVA